MCEDCGCGDPALVPVEVRTHLLQGNDRIAAHNRAHFAERGLLAINLMGSPGSGKTAVLEATARAMGGKRRICAVSGDLATENDAIRLRAAGMESRAITTGTACHLDAKLVHDSLHHLELGDSELLFIENVGNLVCPAIYDLGQAANVVALSVTEGEDKPLKYPVMFKRADLVLLTKVDLLPHLPQVKREAIDAALARTMPVPRVIPFSAVTGEGVSAWIAYLQDLRSQQGQQSSLPAHSGISDDLHVHDHPHAHPHR